MDVIIYSPQKTGRRRWLLNHRRSRLRLVTTRQTYGTRTPNRPQRPQHPGPDATEQELATFEAVLIQFHIDLAAWQVIEDARRAPFEAKVVLAEEAFATGTADEVRTALDNANMRLRLKQGRGTDETPTKTAATEETLKYERLSQEAFEELQEKVAANPGKFAILAYGPRAGQARENETVATDLWAELWSGDWGAAKRAKARIVHPKRIDDGDGGMMDSPTHPMGFLGDKKDRAECNARLAE